MEKDSGNPILVLAVMKLIQSIESFLLKSSQKFDKK